jgi:hypothetical protein
MENLSEQIAKIQTDIDKTIERSVNNMKAVRARLETIDHPEMKDIIKHLSTANNELVTQLHKQLGRINTIDDINNRSNNPTDSSGTTKSS